MKVRSRLFEIAEYIRDNPKCSCAAIGRYFNIKPSVANHSLKILMEHGSVKEEENPTYRAGSNAMYVYSFIKAAPRHNDGMGLVTKYIKEHKAVTSAEVRIGTGYARANEVMHRMFVVGLLTRTGTRRNFIYSLVGEENDGNISG